MIYQLIDSTLVMLYFKFGENLACFTRDTEFFILTNENAALPLISPAPRDRVFIIIELARIAKGVKRVAIDRLFSELKFLCFFGLSNRYPAMATLFKPSRKRKRGMMERAKKARQAKFSSVASSSDDHERESSNASEPSRSSVDLDESLQLPRPTGEQEPALKTYKSHRRVSDTHSSCIV